MAAERMVVIDSAHRLRRARLHVRRRRQRGRARRRPRGGGGGRAASCARTCRSSSMVDTLEYLRRGGRIGAARGVDRRDAEGQADPHDRGRDAARRARAHRGPRVRAPRRPPRAAPRGRLRRVRHPAHPGARRGRAPGRARRARSTAATRSSSRRSARSSARTSVPGCSASPACAPSCSARSTCRRIRRAGWKPAAVGVPLDPPRSAATSRRSSRVLPELIAAGDRPHRCSSRCSSRCRCTSIYLLRKPISWVLIAMFLAVALSGPVNSSTSG